MAHRGRGIRAPTPLIGESIRFSARKIGVRKVRLGEDHPDSVVGKPNLSQPQIDGFNPNHGICLKPGRTLSQAELTLESQFRP